MCFEALKLGAYSFIIAISSLCNYEMSFFSNTLCSTLISSDINLAAPLFLCLQFVSDIFLTYSFGHFCVFILGMHLL